MLTKLIVTFAASAFSGILYHAGGLGRTTPEEKKEDPWIPLFMRRSWVRDWICPALSLAVLFTWWKPDHLWGYLLAIPSYALMAGALSTYCDKIFGYDNYYAHGFLVGMAVFPLCWDGLAWWWVAAQAVAAGLAMGLLCVLTKQCWARETGRGFIATSIRTIVWR